MKKALAVLLVIALALLMVACMPVAQYYVCPDGHQVLDPKNCEQPLAPEAPASEEPQEPTATEPAPIIVKEITPEAQELLDKSTKVVTVRFSYFESIDPYVEDLYFASRDRMKIELKNKAVFTSSDSYDTVYYDFSGLNAFGYCERQSRETCPDKNKRVSLDYDDYLIKTPFDWLKSIDRAELTGKSKMIDRTPVKEISFQSGGKSGTMFLDSFYGMPFAVNYEGVDYEFKGLAINTGSVEDLVHQQMVNE